MEVLALSELIDFKAGEIIFRENDPGDRMYIIRSGTVDHQADQ
jgi:CRP-like cAMP-binding protein